MMSDRIQTLCWDCAKACGRCPWSDPEYHRTVSGWDVIPTKIRMNKDTFADSYIVISCPEFERDAFGGGVYRVRSEKE